LEALVPILVRPVREQLEHDRIIRLLEAKWRRKFKVEANPGDERNAGVKGPVGTVYPDLVLTEEGGRKPKALIEVETNESVNHLEAMSQWANLAKARTALLLFVPVGAVEAARRLAAENAIKVAELWTYLVLGDQVRFTSVFRDGSEPADLIEKADVFTTERSAPVPRPVPAEVVEPPAPVQPVAAPERPRKLAVKVGTKGADGAAAKPATVAAKGAAPSATAAPAPPAAAKPVPSSARAVPAKPAAQPAAAAKVAAAKPVAPQAASPVKNGKPEAAKPAKPAPATAEPARPAKAAPPKAAKPVEKPVRKAPPAAVKKAPIQKVARKAAAKPAPARKAGSPTPAARAAASKKKAAPARPAARAGKKSPPVKTSKPATKRR
jgi:hypothetical protein